MRPPIYDGGPNSGWQRKRDSSGTARDEKETRQAMLWVALAMTPILYGVGDFFAGDIAKRVKPLFIVGFTSSISIVCAYLWARFTGTLEWDTATVLRGIAAGGFYLAANALFYLALSKGKSAVVGSILCLSIFPSIIVDAFYGDLPPAQVYVGIVMIVVGVVLIALPELSGSVSKAAILFAIAAAVTLGTQYAVLGRASMTDSNVAILTQYSTAFVLVVILGLSTRTMGGISRPVMPRLIFLGLVFGVAGLLFSTAMSGINSAIAAAVVNTEPIVLAILGYFFAKQKLSRGDRRGDPREFHVSERSRTGGQGCRLACKQWERGDHVGGFAG